MNRIQRVSLFFKIVFQILFIILPIFLIIGWINSPESFVTMGGMINMNFIPRNYVGHILHELSHSERFLGFCVSGIPLVFELYIISTLVSLFKLYERGEIFSINNVRYIRNIGYALLMTQLFNPIYELLMGYVLTRNNPPGQRFASVTLDQTNVGILVAALIIILISWIMAEGCKLREEQQLTI